MSPTSGVQTRNHLPLHGLTRRALACTCQQRPATTSDDDSDHVNDGRVVQDERMPHYVTQINATVYYSSDERTVHHMLSADTMVSWGTGTKGSWGLVEEKGLSNVPPGVPPGPPISRPAVGRPQSARLKPAAGPTSGRHRSGTGRFLEPVLVEARGMIHPPRCQYLSRTFVNISCSRYETLYGGASCVPCAPRC